MKTFRDILSKIKNLFLFFVIILNGCLNLDPFLFKGEKVDKYLLDNYTGERECQDAIDSILDRDKYIIKEFTINSGVATIAALYVSKKDEIPNSTDTVILYIHGTGPHIDYYWPRTLLLASTGYSVLVFDYKGYGKSTGTPTEEGIYEDGFAALKFLQNEYGNPKVVLYSYSLGSLVGCELASKDKSGKIVSLVLEAPINTIETLVEDAAYINIPGNYVTTYKGDNSKKIREVKCPLLWLHGTDDETVDLETNGRKVFENYNGEKGVSLIVKGAKHGNIPTVLGYNNYIKAIRNFISGNNIN